MQNVKHFNDESYQEKITQFLIDRGCMEDGHASERVADLIAELVKEK